MEPKLLVRDGMSKNINVNPGQYKVAGRERQGEQVNVKAGRAKLAKNTQGGRPRKTQSHGPERKS